MVLEDVPRYTALSYSWRRDKAINCLLDNLTRASKGRGSLRSADNPGKILKHMQDLIEAEETILCNGKIINVTASLHECLAHLRRTKPGDYWIDAMCINQADAMEKNRQIDLMGKIYSKAELVVVWLGSCPELLREGIEQLLSSDTDLFQMENDTTRSPSSDEQDQADNQLLSLIGAIGVLSSRWFSRLWVVQEVCLARCVRFLSGEYEIPKEVMASASDWTYQHKLDLDTLLVPAAWHSSVQSTTNNVLEALRFFAQANVALYGSHIKDLPMMLGMQYTGPWTLARWLQVCKGRRASKVEDLVFAGLTLISPDQLRIEEDLLMPPPLPPRPGAPRPSRHSMEHRPPLSSGGLWQNLKSKCEATSEEVLLNLSACIMSQPNGIHILSATSSFKPVIERKPSNRDPDPTQRALPSWLLDPSSWSSTDGQVTKSLEAPTYSACTNMSCQPRLSYNGRMLVLEGAVLDVIDSTLQCPNDGDLEDDLMPPFLLDGPREYPHSPNLSVFEAFIRVRASGYHITQQLSPAEAVEGYCRMLRFFVRTVQNEIKEDFRISASERAHISQLLGESDKANSEKWVKGYEKAFTMLNKGSELVLKEKKVTKARLNSILESYASLRNAYPNIPLPDLEKETRGNGTKENLMHLSLAAVNGLCGNKLFRTKRGYIGRGPGSFRCGDSILLVKGGAVPFVLRRVQEERDWRISNLEQKMQDEKVGSGRKRVFRNARSRLRKCVGEQDKAWIFIGEAYVEGAMYGEAVDSCIDRFERLVII